MAIISISAPEPTSEGDSGTKTFTFTVTREGDASAAAMVDYYKAPDSGPGTTTTADFGTSARFPGGTVYFAAGETSKTITVQVAGDTAVEPDESFTIALSNVRGGDSIGTGRATTTILNDDSEETPPIASLTWGTTSAGVSRQEGDSGTTTFTYVVNRAGDTDGVTTVDWRVTPTTASNGDFAGPLAGTLTFAAGENSKEISVVVAGDTAPETDETFEIRLSNAPGATVPFDARTGRILNDDGVQTTSTYAISGPGVKAEGTGGTTAFDFTVTRSGDTSQLGMVDYFTVGETDAADFSGRTTATLSFAPGETSKTIRLEVVGDSTREGDEDFFVGLSNARGGTITTGRANSTILNDDADTPPAATLSWGTNAAGLTQNEGDSGATAFTYVLNRSGDTNGTTSVDWRVNFTSVSPDEFTGATAGTVTFAPGELSKEITVNVLGDTTPESDELFSIVLSNSPGASYPTSGMPGKIVNDDFGGPGPATLTISGPGSKAEGDASTTVFDFTVTRSGDLSGTTLVDYFTIGETNAADFTGRTTSTLYFAPGETSKVIHIEVVGDTTAEEDEDFMVGLSNVRGGTIGVGSAPGTILNDDGWAVG